MNNYLSTEESDKHYSDILQHLSPTFACVMRQVYLWMTFALCVSGLTAHIVANNPVFVSYIFIEQSWIFWCLTGFLLVVGISLAVFIDRLSLPLAFLFFVVYSLANGVILSSVFIIYTIDSISSVFFITAGLFLTMSVVGYMTKKDLTSLGNLFYVGLWGLILATIVNIFIHSSVMTLIISYIGVVIFIGLTAYDTQKIKLRLLRSYLSPSPEPSTSVYKMALLGAFDLYLDFLNLFLYLLRIFGKKK